MKIMPLVVKGKALYSTLTKDHRSNHQIYGFTEQFPHKETYTNIRTVFRFSSGGSAPDMDIYYVTTLHMHSISDDDRDWL